MDRPARLMPLLAAGVLAVVAWATPAAAAGVATKPYSAVFQREDSLVRAGRWDLSQAMLDSLVRTARVRGDRQLEFRALLQRGGRQSYRGEAEAGERDLKEALKLAPEVRDTTLWCAALRKLTLTYQNSGRLQESAPLAFEGLRLARAQGHLETEALAEILVAYQKLCEGQYSHAIPLYRSAIADLEHGGPNAEALEARVGLARAYDALGETNAARNEYQRVIERSADFPGWLSGANSWNNLGNIEMAEGDPSTALADWNRALAIYEQAHKSDYARATRLNAAQALVDLGRHEEAAATIDSVLRESKSVGDLDHAVRAWIALAEVRGKQGRNEQALANADSALAMGRALTPESRAAAELVQVTALDLSGRTAEARAQAAGIVERAGGTLPALQRHNILLERVDLELRSGQPAAALKLLESGGPDSSSGAWRDRLLRSRAHAAMGQPDLALRELEQAAAGWERWRGSAGDPEWRESRGPDSRMLYQEFQVLVASRPPGAARADAERRSFDALQRFKARTLEERMGGRLSASHAREPASLAWLQGGGLHQGELFLDYYVGPDSAFACAVTSQGLRWISLRDTGPLLARVRRSGSLFAAHGVDDAAISACDAAASALGAELLGAFSDLLRSAKRVVVSPDGELAGVPFGALRLEGRALLADREVVLAPSATVLRNLRPAAGASESNELLALAGGAGAKRLPGADQEVRWLERNVQNVRVLENPTAAGREALLGRLAACGSVHVAAHTEVNVEAPWRSGIQLTASAAPQELEFLRASTIAGLRLSARLAVLSSCQSYGSRDLFGEGALGLSTAFLGAGVPSVLCTLWPVDDRATATFMQDFYSKLLEGETPAGALRGAQLEAISRPETRHPSFWAGFVLVGKPDSRLGLHRHV